MRTKRRELPKHVTADTSRHGLRRYYFRRGLGPRTRMPAPDTPQFWEMYRELLSHNEAVAVKEYEKWKNRKNRNPLIINADAKEIDYEKAKFPRRRKSSRVGVMSFEQYLIEIIRSGRNRAKKKKVPYDIDTDYVLDMARKQDFRCALTGIKFFTHAAADSRIPPFVPSIDRIVPKRGYVKGNVRLVCFAVNAMMLDWGESIFRHVAREYNSFRNRTPKTRKEGIENNSIESTSCDGILRSRRLAQE